MILQGNRLAAATAVAAAFSLSAIPASAAELPRVTGQAQPWDPDALDVEGHHGHRGDWDDDWDIDGDDILTGVLILGGLAAIAGIANSSRHQQPSYPEPEPLPDDAAFQPPAREDSYRSGGMAQAVEVCVAEVEDGRGAVSSVDRASRSGEGWFVAGEIDGGTPFSCWIDGAGRVTDIEAGDYSARFETPAEGPASYSTVQKQAIESGGEGQLALAQAAE